LAIETSPTDVIFLGVGYEPDQTCQSAEGNIPPFASQYCYIGELFQSSQQNPISDISDFTPRDEEHTGFHWSNELQFMICDTEYNICDPEVDTSIGQ